MKYAEMILPEFDQEIASTRKVLERIPEDKLEWKAHPKSHTIGWNANHVADLPNWLVVTLTKPSLTFAPVGDQPTIPKLATRRDILDLFDRNVAAARQAIMTVKDEDVSKQWSLSGRASRSSPCRGRRWSAASSSTTSSTIALICASISA